MYSEHYHPSYYLDSLPYYQPTNYSTQSYETTYFNTAVYQNQTMEEINTSRSIDEQPKVAISNRKRKYQDENLKSQYESEPCRVCDDVSSGYHFGVFTCEACKGFFRRYSKKSTILEPCPVRCGINKNNRNNCAACRFDKCKGVGMALDKIRFGKPPKIFRSTLTTSSVKLEPNHDDFQLMLKLLECYQSFEEYDHQTTTSIICQFCHRLADIVMPENERIPETFLARLKRHQSAIKFLITGENEENLLSWSREPQAWIFAHNERWRLIMILLILAFDDEQIGGLSNFDLNEHHLERILRLFELECDQEGGTMMTNEKNLKYMKAQFVLRFVDMMTNDMISNRIYDNNNFNQHHQPYLISEDPIHNQMIYLACDEDIQHQTTEHI